MTETAAAFPVRVDQRGPVLVWTIDREARMNSLSRDVLLALGRLAREALTNDSVRAIVITGAGDKAFCAGADLKERRGMSENDIRAQVELYRSELGPLDRSPKPVIIAALNGVASRRWSSELALICDLRRRRGARRAGGSRRRRWGSSLERAARNACRASSGTVARRR